MTRPVESESLAWCRRHVLTDLMSDEIRRVNIDDTATLGASTPAGRKPNLSVIKDHGTPACVSEYFVYFNICSYVYSSRVQYASKKLAEINS